MHINKLLFCLMMLSFAACKKENLCSDTTLPVLGTCVAVAPHGNLTYNSATQTYTYKTKGGGTIVWTTQQIRIMHDNYSNFKYELWGQKLDSASNSVHGIYVYENLNGKHIKNRIGSNRTIVFPDGAKVTLAANSDSSRVLSVSIYDGADSYRFNTTCNKTLEHSLADECITQALDNAEPDGEAGSFEITSTGLMFFNLYTEDTPGNKVEKRYNLGELFLNEPNKIDDYYDDPRLGHT